MANMLLQARLALLDIEGTVSPLAFVRDEMFPFAARRYGSFFAKQFDSPGLARALALLQADAAMEPKPWPVDDAGKAAAYCAYLTEQDRKATGLKAVQGLIWDEGFASGELRPPLFSDVKPALKRWQAAGCHLAIYSSGSEHAQRQFFAHTSEGDLGALFAGYFDTTVGGKREAASYLAIASKLALAPELVCFFSDIVAELESARQAGMQAVLVNRPGNAAQPAWDGLVIADFSGVNISG